MCKRLLSLLVAIALVAASLAVAENVQKAESNHEKLDTETTDLKTPGISDESVLDSGSAPVSSSTTDEQNDGDHHVKKRSFDSISGQPGGVHGIEQVFVSNSDVGDDDESLQEEDMSGFGDGISYGPDADALLDGDYSSNLLQYFPLWYLWLTKSSPAILVTNEDVDDQDYSTKNNVKRGFDSIARWGDGVSGMTQNFIGPKRGDYNLRHSSYSNYPGWSWLHSQKKRFDPISNGNIFGLNQNHISKRYKDTGVADLGYLSSEELLELEELAKELSENGDDLGVGPFNWDAQESDINDLDIVPALGKRKFDSINRGHIFGIGQNHISKRPHDSIHSLGSNSILGMGQNFLQTKPNRKPKRFDSIGRSKIGGMYQNFLNKKMEHTDSYTDYFPKVLYRKKRDVGQAGKDNIATVQTDSKHETNKRDTHGIEFSKHTHLRDAHEKQNKRQFDPISSGALGGLGQNFLSKRTFDPIGNSVFGGMGQNFVSKRPFDPISSSHMGGLEQNFVGKRPFDPIGSSLVGGMGQNFVGKRTFDPIGTRLVGGLSQNFVGKRPFDPISSSLVGGMEQNFVGKRQFDPISSSLVSGLGQNFVGKRPFDPIGNSLVGGMGQNFVGKRTFDPISSSLVSGMGQNFVGKRPFDPIGSSLVGGMGQNFVGKRTFDPISSSFVSGMGQNFVGKRPFDPIGSSLVGGMGQNFVGKRTFDPISSSFVSGMGQNFVGKRPFDPIGTSLVGGMEQNFVGKRQFDPISSNYMGGLRQNFINKRQLDSIASSHIGGMRQNFIHKRPFDPLGSSSIGGLRQNFVNRKRSVSNKDGGSSLSDRLKYLSHLEHVADFKTVRASNKDQDKEDKANGKYR